MSAFTFLEQPHITLTPWDPNLDSAAVPSPAPVSNPAACRQTVTDTLFQCDSGRHKTGHAVACSPITTSAKALSQDAQRTCPSLETLWYSQHKLPWRAFQNHTVCMRCVTQHARTLACTRTQSSDASNLAFPHTHPELACSNLTPVPPIHVSWLV